MIDIYLRLYQAMYADDRDRAARAAQNRQEALGAMEQGLITRDDIEDRVRRLLALHE